jgi:hypothetical protein
MVRQSSNNGEADGLVFVLDRLRRGINHQPDLGVGHATKPTVDRPVFAEVRAEVGEQLGAALSVRAMCDDAEHSAISVMGFVMGLAATPL